jgi:hypothetical protein|tara:strand:+ start:107 stop:571 length:465 start_codon:yes stop_codon:yes gene_type:complete
MSWDIFRSEYKSGHATLGSNDKTKMASVIASSYDKCIKTGFANAPAAGPLAVGNVKGFEAALIPCFLGFGTIPFSVALDNGLKIYWLGGLTASGAAVIVPGVTGAFIDPQGKLNENLDDFIEQLITSFKTHLAQISGTQPAAPSPLPWVGYNVI